MRNLICSLIIFLISMLAKASPFERQSLIQGAYRQLPSIFEFLEKNPKFYSSLTDKEKVAFRDLNQVIGRLGVALYHSQAMYFNPDYRPYSYGPSDSSTANPEKYPGLSFEKDIGQFLLEGESSARSAKTSPEWMSPIQINLDILNAETVSISYLDALQILIHELAHKTNRTSDLNQLALFDSVAAKAIGFLKDPYFILTEPRPGVQVYALALPMFDQGIKYRTSYQFNAVFIEKDGVVRYDYYDFHQLGINFNNFTKIAGNFQEKVSIQLSDITDISSEEKSLNSSMKLIFQMKSEPVFHTPNMHLVGSNPLTGEMFYEPQEIPLLKREFFASISGQVTVSTPRLGDRVPPQILLMGPFGYQVEKYFDLTANAKVISLRQDSKSQKIQLSFSKTATSTFQTVYLEATSPNGGKFYLPAKPIYENDKVITYSAELPNYTKNSDLKISSVIVNDDSIVRLSRPLHLKGQGQATARSQIQITSLEYFNGKTWVDYNSNKVSLQSVDNPELTFRLRVSTQSSIAQIKLNWNQGSELYLQTPDKKIGWVGLGQLEIISQYNVQQLGDGQQEFTFKSNPYLHQRIVHTRDEAVKQQDSGMRFLRGVEILDVTGNEGYRIFRRNPGKMIFTGEGFYFKDINSYRPAQKSGPAKVILCRKVFSNWDLHH